MTEAEELQAWRALYWEEFDFGEVKGTAEYSFADDWIYRQDAEALQYKVDPLPTYKGTRRRSFLTEQQRLKKKYLCYKSGMVYFSAFGETPKNRYVRQYLSKGRKYAKWSTNHRLRHTNDFVKHHGGYRKVFDYAWTIW